MKEREIKRLGKATKSTNLELKKTQAELKTIDDEIAVTEYNRDENPETYTTDELTVARAIRNAILIMKMHQLFCENHNPTLQDTLRVQKNADGSTKIMTFDFPSYYSKALENFQKILNQNTLEVGH